jgi:hypothetical protein
MDRHVEAVLGTVLCGSNDDGCCIAAFMGNSNYLLLRGAERFIHGWNVPSAAEPDGVPKHPDKASPRAPILRNRPDLVILISIAEIAHAPTPANLPTQAIARDRAAWATRP